MIMKKAECMKTAKMKFADRVRYGTNSVALVLMNLNVFGFSFKKICAPGFQCHGCPWATFACPVGAVSYNLTLRMIPYYAIGAILLVGFLCARLVCSYVCPFGFFQDLLYRIPWIPKFTFPRFLRYGKYAVLLLLVILFPYWLGFTDGSPYVNIQLGLAKNTENPEFINLSQIQVTNLSTVPLKGLPLTIQFFTSEGAPDPEHLPEYHLIADAEILPGMTVGICDYSVPNVTALGGTIELSSPLSRPLQGSPAHLYVCEWCPLGELTAALPKKIARSVGVENPSNSFFTWDWLSPSPVVPVSTSPAALTASEVPVQSEPVLLRAFANPEHLTEALKMSAQTRLAEPPLVETRSFFDWRFGLTALFVLAMFIFSRPFCRSACPLGAVFGLCTPFSPLKMKVDHGTCVNCGACDRVCPMELDVRKEAGSAECIFCNNCVKRCPKDSITRTFLKG